MTREKIIEGASTEKLLENGDRLDILNELYKLWKKPQGRLELMCREEHGNLRLTSYVIHMIDGTATFELRETRKGNGFFVEAGEGQRFLGEILTSGYDVLHSPWNNFELDLAVLAEVKSSNGHRLLPGLVYDSEIGGFR